jgi:hypothetical protein
MYLINQLKMNKAGVLGNKKQWGGNTIAIPTSV